MKRLQKALAFMATACFFFLFPEIAFPRANKQIGQIRLFVKK
jgi:hypothetical protein